MRQFFANKLSYIVKGKIKDWMDKNECSALFSWLGLDMSSTVNIFLHQCVLRGGLPFAVEMPAYSQKTLDAMAEVRCISRVPDVKGYSRMEDLKAALDD